MSMEVRSSWCVVYIYMPKTEERPDTYRWAGVDWEKETRLLDLVIEFHPRYRWLNNNVHARSTRQQCPQFAESIADSLVLVQGNDLIHKGKVNAHATKRSREVGFQA